MGNRKWEGREEPENFFPSHFTSSGPSSSGRAASEAQLALKNPTRSPDPCQWSQCMGSSNTTSRFVLQPKDGVASCSCQSLDYLSIPCLVLSSSVTRINNSLQ